MRRKTNTRVEPDSISSTAFAPVATPEPPRSGLTDEQVVRWAELIAAGGSAPPADLSLPDTERLNSAVSELLKKRMVRLVARAIAADVLRRSPDVEE